MTETNSTPSKKSNILFISRKSPYGKSTAKESLDAILAASSYEQNLSLLFLGDGVFQLKSGQNPDKQRQKNISATLPALSMYDINNIYVQASALTERGLNESDMVISAELLSNAEITQLMEQQDQLLSF